MSQENGEKPERFDRETGGGMIGAAIRNPVTVTVGVLLIALFGLQALFAVPIQLTPDVSRPVISVVTPWPGANPQEVEREIVERQEDVLKSLEGLLSMESESSPNVGRVTLEFAPGTDLDIALLRANNALAEVPAYPAEAEKPVLATTGDRENAIGWFILVPRDRKVMPEIDTYLEFLEDEVQSRVERVPGVAALNIFGGREERVEVIVDPTRLAARGLTLREVASKISAEDRDVSAGDFDEGKRRYVLRTVGAFGDPSEILDVVLRDEPAEQVFLRDVATARLGHEEAQMVVRFKGIPAIAMNIQNRPGSNVLAVMDGVRQAFDDINDNILAPKNLEIVQAYDATIYIRSALDLVQQNLVIGSTLAILVLLFFLRSLVPTAIIAVAIPVSAVGTFLAMYLLGRNINIVSLAGLSFAVGMLVDNSIVVLEAIFARVEKGQKRFPASVEGTREVWGAVLASTLTTVAVFLPIFFLEAEVAQLFRDIAIAISCAVSLSLVVSVFAIPAMASRWIHPEHESKAAPWIARAFVNHVSSTVHRVCGSTALRVVVIVAMTTVSIAGSWLMSPPAEYLPGGNQNLLFGLLIPPAGYNLEEFDRIGDRIAGELRPLWEGDDPKVDKFFYVAFGRQVIMGIGATRDEEIGELRGPVYAALAKIPGMIAIVMQPGLFDRGLAGGRSIDLKLQGPDLGRLIGMAQRSFGAAMEHLPGSQVQPIPGLELGQPEIQLLPDRERLAEVGLNAGELGFAFDVLMDGARVSEIRTPDGRKIDLTLLGNLAKVRHTQALGLLPVATPNEGVVPLESLAELKTTMGPDTIQHYERERSITLRISPPATIPLEEAMDIVRQKIVKPLEDEGELGGLYKWRMAGTADKLTATRKALQGNFAVAVLVTYLLMASLFGSFLYPFVIMFSVPLAGLGGFAALRGVNLAIAPQSLDVLTMLGFIILVGVVVNNAILLVDRALRNVRFETMSPQDAVTESVGARIRPIFMTTLTSVFGMAPLVLMTGPGSELYRGIGSVVIGGILVSTVFTLLLIPALLSLVLEWRERLGFSERR